MHTRREACTQGCSARGTVNYGRVVCLDLPIVRCVRRLLDHPIGRQTGVVQTRSECSRNRSPMSASSSISGHLEPVEVTIVATDRHRTPDRTMAVRSVYKPFQLLLQRELIVVSAERIDMLCPIAHFVTKKTLILTRVVQSFSSSSSSIQYGVGSSLWRHCSV